MFTRRVASSSPIFSRSLPFLVTHYSRDEGKKYAEAVMQQNSAMSVEDFRSRYGTFKKNYRDQHGEKPNGVEKHVLIVSFCKHLKISTAEIKSDTGASFPSQGSSAFNVGGYLNSLVALVNKRLSLNDGSKNVHSAEQSRDIWSFMGKVP